MVEDYALIFQHIDLNYLNSGAGSAKVVVTRHPVFTQDDGQRLLGAGRRVANRDLRSMRKSLDRAFTDGEGWLEDALLFRTGQEMAWFVPAQKRPIYFRVVGNKVFTYQIQWPTLVFRYHETHGFRIVACAGTHRPTPDRKLYHAPLWNIGDKGTLCLGSASGGNDLSAASRRQWEEAVFESAFSHSNHDRVIRYGRKKPENPDQAYLSFIRDKHRTGQPIFSREMVPFGMALGQWLERGY